MVNDSAQSRDENEYFEFLEILRKSGVTNMFGAAPYLVDAFSISNREARDILLKWMKSYDRTSGN
jgi:hypothetical protein